VLDAFFLGRALAEVVLERVGSAVGELLSDVGRAQAEQQQRIREFQVCACVPRPSSSSASASSRCVRHTLDLIL